MLYQGTLVKPRGRGCGYVDGGVRFRYGERYVLSVS